MRVLKILWLAGLLPLAAAGQDIRNGDGTPLTRTWCHEDTLHPVSGFPSGGQFTGCGVTAVNGVWYFNPVTASAGAPGFPYQCMLIYEPPGGAGSVSQLMRIHTPVVAGAGEDRVSCDGHIVLLAAEHYAGVYHHRWTAVSGNHTLEGIRAEGNITEDETFVLTTVDVATGCSGKDTVTIRYENPEVRIAAGRDTLCLGEELVLTANGSMDSLSFRWYGGDGALLGTGDRLVYHGRYTGQETLMLLSESRNCADTAFYPLHIRNFDLKLITDSELAGRSSDMTLRTEAQESYRIVAWSPAYLFPDQQAFTQQLKTDSAHTYQVTGVSAYGCTDTAELFVPMSPVLFIPAAFSPNGDGRNDFFRPAVWGGAINMISLSVFDRWGRMVWHASGAEAARGWNGMDKTLPAAIGVYYYVLDAERAADGYRIREQGDVTLLR